ncbi:MAG: hypothetical protein DCC56_02885 [Anaerolineae bacterium]|nr:MAG: hypothetical protein DCC56_02885 [Anaerolineae bacterium]WKZ44217.1 MAG: hypothetical protein QY302_00330 [Anaerolineales bacterium]
MAQILDTFDRANEGPPPSSNWVNVLNGLKVVGNQCKGNEGSGGSNVSFWDDVFGPDVEVDVTLVSKGGANEYCAIFARMTTQNIATMDGYFLLLEPQSGTDMVSIWKITDGSITQIGNTVNYELSGDTPWRFKLVGEDIRALRWDGDEWIEVLAVQDSSYLDAGYTGLAIVDINAILDDFGAETILSALVVTPAAGTVKGGTVNPSVAALYSITPSASQVKGSTISPSVLLVLILSPNPAIVKVAGAGPIVIGGGINPLGEGDSPGFIVFMLARSVYWNLFDAGLAAGLNEPNESNASEWENYLFG